MEPQQYPVNVTAEYPEKSSRLLAACTLLFLIPKMVILIPHLVALWALGIAAFFAMVFAQFAVLFTGAYPKSFFDFNLGVARWRERVSLYMMGLTDIYPPFTLN